jgi:hypothetical protein
MQGLVGHSRNNFLFPEQLSGPLKKMSQIQLGMHHC